MTDRNWEVKSNNHSKQMVFEQQLQAMNPITTETNPSCEVFQSNWLLDVLEKESQKQVRKDYAKSIASPPTMGKALEIFPTHFRQHSGHELNKYSRTFPKKQEQPKDDKIEIEVAWSDNTNIFLHTAIAFKRTQTGFNIVDSISTRYKSDIESFQEKYKSENHSCNVYLESCNNLGYCQGLCRKTK